MCIKSVFFIVCLILLIDTTKAPSSSMMSRTRYQDRQTASTSALHPEKALENRRHSFSEIDLQPLVDKPRRVTFDTSINVPEASSATYSDGNINPARDGVFARIRNAMLRNGLSVAIGGAIGAGGIEINRIFFQENNQTIENPVFNINETQANTTLRNESEDYIVPF